MPPIVNCVVDVVTVSELIDVVDETLHDGAVPQVAPKLTTHDVSVPPPAVTLPKLSDPATAGLPVPQLEIEGDVDEAKIWLPTVRE